MKYIAYELRKIIGIKYIRIIFAVLLLLNGIFCLYQVSESNNTRLPANTVKNIFYEYSISPDLIEEEFKTRSEWESKQNDIFIEQMRQGNYDYEPETLPNKYAPDGYTDIQVFSEIFDRIEYIKRYPSNVQNVIDSAYANLGEFELLGIPKDSYIADYQRKVIELYDNAKNKIRIGFEYTRGWDDYFSYDIVNIFIFLMVITVGTAIFTEEKTSGFLPLLRGTKNGRTKTAGAKVAVTLILTFITVLLFSLESWILILATVGYSNPMNALQSFNLFLYCPYILKIGEYFIISFFIKLLTFFLIASIMLFISIMLYHYALSFISGICLFGVGILINVINISSENPLKILDFLSAAAVTPLFERYRAYNIFGYAVGYVELTPFIFIILTAMLLFLTTLKYNLGSNGVNIKLYNWFLSKVKSFFINSTCCIRKVNKRSYSLSLLAAESYKTLIASRFYIIILLLLLVKCFINANIYMPRESYSDRIYKEYMTILSGEMTDEKRQYLIDERSMIDTAIAKKDEMQLLYVNDEISFDEYRQYLSEYNYAYSRNECFEIIENHAGYIDDLNYEGLQAWFIYDTGWKKLFFINIDWTLYLVLILLFTSVFSKEYNGKQLSGSFVQIMRISKKGRNKTLLNKYLSSCVICVIISVVWYMIDIISVYNSYEMPLMMAPIQSIELMSDFALNITVGQYIVMFMAVKMLASILFTVFLCSLSELLCKPVLTIITTSISAFLPTLLSWFGTEILSIIDFTLFARATPLLLKNQAAIVYIVLCFIICAALFLGVRKKWNQN